MTSNPTRSLAHFFVLGTLSIVLSVACAPKLPPTAELGSVTGYDRMERHTPPEDGFELAPESVDPAAVVPSDLLQGPHHVVRSVRLDHRFLYTYVIESTYGDLEVAGRGLLRKRVMELEALAVYEEHKHNGAQLYAYEVANAVGDPIEGTLQIVRHPVRTMTNVPKGAVASFKAMNEMMAFSRTHLEDDYLDEMIGLSGRKREWAQILGVDPYTTNPYVQAALKRNGWLTLAGDMTVRLATIPVPVAGASIALSTVGATSDLNTQLRDIAPEDVRVTSRSWLKKNLGIEGDDAEAFLEHRWYSPTQQDTIIRSLARIENAENRVEFIRAATAVDEAHEAFAFTRLALMFAESHVRRAPIAEFFSAEDLIMARTVDGDLVLPLYMDYGYWTAEVSRAEQAIARALEGRDVSNRLLVLSGGMSPRATLELELRGWQVVAGAEGLWLTDIDKQAYRPMSSDEARILPELGR